jgi:TPR repeat protein
MKRTKSSLTAVFAAALLVPTIAYTEVVVNGYKECSHTDDGRAFCRSAETGKLAFVSEQIVEQYNSANAASSSQASKSSRIEKTTSQKLEEAKQAYEASDFQSAARIWGSLAETGNAEAQFQFGRLYLKGEGVTTDYSEAAKWFRKSVDQGNAGAENGMGVLYTSGFGVPKDPQVAQSWFRKSAEKGFALAQLNMGRLYQDGRGVQKDLAEASRWYQKAADQGDQVALAKLNELKASLAGGASSAEPPARMRVAPGLQEKNISDAWNSVPVECISINRRKLLIDGGIGPDNAVVAGEIAACGSKNLEKRETTRQTALAPSLVGPSFEVKAKWAQIPSECVDNPRRAEFVERGTAPDDPSISAEISNCLSKIEDQKRHNVASKKLEPPMPSKPNVVGTNIPGPQSAETAVAGRVAKATQMAQADEIHQANNLKVPVEGTLGLRLLLLGFIVSLVGAMVFGGTGTVVIWFDAEDLAYSAAILGMPFLAWLLSYFVSDVEILTTSIWTIATLLALALFIKTILLSTSHNRNLFVGISVGIAKLLLLPISLPLLWLSAKAGNKSKAAKPTLLDWLLNSLVNGPRVNEKKGWRPLDHTTKTGADPEPSSVNSSTGPRQAEPTYIEVKDRQTKNGLGPDSQFNQIQENTLNHDDDVRSIEQKITDLTGCNEYGWFNSEGPNHFKFEDGVTVETEQTEIDDVDEFLEEYENMTLWKSSEYDGTSFADPEIEGIIDEAGNMFKFQYIFDFSAVAGIGCRNATATYTFIQFGEGNDIGSRVSIADGIDRQVLEKWIDKVVQKGWQVEEV